ncbi:ABC transporter ATP-binding protein [Clostridium sp. LIBA-8841]|uniref:ABC transporter ATP-binding protein n=1 Tax=Clostridium sp. LIBA-8841 TaxID=2987530 RepID=UPI002AC45BA0|nr:ABC transporter ATP-binding protein [Clostridium sp. LIBA-8841]MDZ5255051.1 ABC transporter ATP-binding protein/permease [Clostridium sp. LIBA-8841]
MLKKFIQYYKPYKKLFILDLLAAFLVAACDLVYPMITRNIINNVIPNKQIRLLFVFATVLTLIFLVKAGLNYFMQYWGHVVGVRMQADMRRDLFEKLQDMPNKYFDNNKTGVLMSRIVNDLLDISELAHHGPEDLFISIVMLFGSFIILCTINIPLTIITFALLPFLIFYTIRKKNKMREAFKDTRVKTGEVNATIENSISGVKVTKSFGNKTYEMDKFDKSNNIFKKAREHAYKAMAEYFSGMFFLIDMLELIVLIAAGYFTYLGKINLGDFAAYLLYIKMFLQPIRKLINFNEMFQNGMSGFERYEEIMGEENEKEIPNAKELKDVKGKISIKDVTFRYDNKESILENFNLDIKAGKMVALVGPSGGGKTTVCNLIPRFYDYESGKIFIDDVDISTVTLKSLRENIGIVQQDVFLFTGTIKENIMYGNPKATEEEVIEAAKNACLHDFIMGLEDGYDTFIGERGVKLSGGQKQRIAIARVFLKNPAILILDEATSALDNVTEYEIQKALEELSKDRTTLVVAHRLSTVKNSDEIIVLTDKGIEERGNHEELIKLGGVYSHLHNL